MVALLIISALYIHEQLQRISPADEFDFCERAVEKYAQTSLHRVKYLAGMKAVDYALNNVEAKFETMFQILAVFVQKDMDVFYEDYLQRMSILTGKVVTALQLVEFGHPTDYRRRVKFLTDKFCDHLALLSQKQHGLEAEQCLTACASMLDQAAEYDKFCLVSAATPLRNVALTLVQRRERTGLISVLSTLLELYKKHPSKEFAAATLYIYKAVLVEALLNGDRMILNEVLFKLKTLNDIFLPKFQNWTYKLLWVVALKGVEHSAHGGLGSFMQTFVSRFDTVKAANVMSEILRQYIKSGNIERMEITVRSGETVRDTRMRQAIDALNPNYEFIKDSLDYCLEKLIFLWFGQQFFTAATVLEQTNVVLPPTVHKALKGKYLWFLSLKLPDDGYGMHWAKNPNIVRKVYEILCSYWRITPEPHELMESLGTTHLEHLSAAPGRQGPVDAKNE